VDPTKRSVTRVVRRNRTSTKTDVHVHLIYRLQKHNTRTNTGRHQCWPM